MKRILFFTLTCILTTSTQAQVTIGSSEEPVKGALLDIKSGAANSTTNVTSESGGLVLPRVRLEDRATLQPFIKLTDKEWGTLDKDKTSKMHAGMIVYNLNTTSPFTEGLYCWNGNSWRKMDDSPTIETGIGEGQLLCGSATMSPATYTAGVQLVNYFLKVPYTGGTGGAYDGALPVEGTNGLSIERIGGKLAFGSGEIVYRVTGKPEKSSPTTTTFPIDFLGESCFATVGAVTSVNVRNLTSNVDVNTANNVSSTTGPTKGTILPFEEIKITETGSYAFSLRLYGRIPTSYKARIPYYIYLQKNDRNNILDAAEIDVSVVTENQDYSYSVTMGGYFEEGDTVIISMNRLAADAPWTLKAGANNQTAIRTSLIYWKL